MRLNTKSKANKYILSSFALLPLFISATSHAENKLQEVLDRGYLIVGTGSTNAPWHFKDTKNKLAGFDIDMAKLVAKGLFDDENKIKFVDQSGDARIPNLITNKVDLSCQFMTVTPSRAQQVGFTIPYYREGVGLLLMNKSKYSDYDSLKAAGDSVVVAVLQNVYAEEMVHAALPKAEVDQYESVALMYQALNSGRADAAATDQSSLRWYMVQNPGHYKDSGYAWMPQSYACAVKKGDQEWLNFVNVVFHEAMTGVDFGAYSQSFEKWFGVQLPMPKTGFPVEYK